MTYQHLRALAGWERARGQHRDVVPPTDAQARVVDNVAQVLEGLGQLQRLDVTGTNATSTAIEKLQAALPNCEIQK